MNKSATLAKKLLRTASAHPSLQPSIMPKVARLLKQGQAVEASLHTAKFGDKAEQAKMWAKGYRFIILLETDKATPLYTKTLAQASKLMRTDHKDEKNYKIDPLKDPKGKDASDKMVSVADLREMIRLAAAYPALRERLLPEITATVNTNMNRVYRDAGLHTAAKDSGAFAAWAIARGKKYDDKACEKVLDRLGIPFVEYKPGTRRTGPLDVGETVKADARRNTNEANSEACRKYNEQFGQVEKIESDAVIIRFDRDNQLVRFEGKAKPGKPLGLFRGTRPALERDTGKSLIEVIYFKDKNAPKADPARIEQITEYVERSDDRSRAYYSGVVKKQGTTKDGAYIFLMHSQQRNQWTAVSPKKGTVLYLGRLGGRPGGWKGEYEKMLADAATGDE